MGERIIAKSKRYRIGMLLTIILAFALVACVGIAVITYCGHMSDYNAAEGNCPCNGVNITCDKHVYDTGTEYAWEHSKETVSGAAGIAGGVAALCAIVYLWMRSYEIIVTDKRVYGKAAFGKRIDLPMDSVSAVGTGLLKSLSVATSSGRIAFLLIQNRDELHKSISDLLVERQNKTADAEATQQPASADYTEELKKIKDLLDMGVITQEEFDAKKKQLLGL